MAVAITREEGAPYSTEGGEGAGSEEAEAVSGYFGAGHRDGGGGEDGEGREV